MTEPLAHSARVKDGIPGQGYASHISNVTRRAQENAEKAAKYSPNHSAQLIRAVRLAAEFHDLGKLNAVNQAVLETNTGKMVNHADAGVAHVLNTGINDILAASLIYAHHIGLPDFQDQRNNQAGYVLRDTSIGPTGKTVKETTDNEMGSYVETHMAAVHDLPMLAQDSRQDVVTPLLFRIALSCIVDADHHDTAHHYQNEVDLGGPELRPIDRLNLLDAHIGFIGKSRQDERTLLRNEVYEACKNTDPHPGVYTCDSPVGTGKTTAVMAHLLRAASQKGLRRVFVVLPFTSIIDQSVDTYRRALVGIGEDLENVVAAHHHKAEFDDIASRQLAFLWEAPIVVTTAVQFFETLASNEPAALRKLHQLPGSAIFIDEAHAALPAHLWPQAWLWLRELELRWGCHIVLGSGSLNRFWELPEFSAPPVYSPPELVSHEIRSKAMKYEQERVQYKTLNDLIGLTELMAWLKQLDGPRLLILNTVQSAAVIASEISDQFGREHAEHLSTSLCPRDRKMTLDRVKARLENKSDRNWTLVATSCVESGLDLSFRIALRERCSLNSLIQVGGRVNRKGEYLSSEVWDFRLRYAGLLRPHRAFDTSARVLGEMFASDKVSPRYCTEAMLNEIRSDGMRALSGRILKAEKSLQFPSVDKDFKVIDSDTVTVIVDRSLLDQLERRQKIRRNLLQMLSVQIWWHQKEKWKLVPVDGFPGVYLWPLAYDSFLGYMAGVISVEKFQQGGGAVV